MTPKTLLRALNFSHRRHHSDVRGRLRARLRRKALRNGAIERLEDRTLLANLIPTITTVMSSASTVLPGTPVTLTAQVQP
jgi:hypothetical protein